MIWKCLKPWNPSPYPTPTPVACAAVSGCHFHVDPMEPAPLATRPEGGGALGSVRCPCRALSPWCLSQDQTPRAGTPASCSHAHALFPQ